jgi:periplasmic protein TonB
MTASQPEPRRARFVRGVALSLLLHLALFGAAFILARHTPPSVQRRGEPLFVELPKIAEPAPRGNPAERSKRESRAEPAGSLRAAPDVPAVPPGVRRDAPRTEPPVRMPAREPRVASAPKPEAPPAPTVRERTVPVPPAEARMARPDAQAAPQGGDRPVQLPRPELRLAKPEAVPAQERPTPRPSPAEPSSRPDSQVAKAEAPVPPISKEPPSVSQEPRPGEPAPPAPPVLGAVAERTPAEPGPPGDRLAALRSHARGGGLRDGHGGIEGEAIPLDTRDPKFSDYFDQLRRAIKDKWSYPREAAEKNIGGQLMLEFGIAKDGELRFIELRRSSGVAVLDDYAMNAVKLASPFPRVPDEMSRGGIPVLAVFNYIVQGSLYNVLR